MRWDRVRKPNVTVSAQTLRAGNGGICRVARLSIKALEKTCSVRALAVEDSKNHVLGNVEVQAFSGSRLRFALANNIHIFTGRKLIYDFAGTARAHQPGMPVRTSYAVWIHGVEVWNFPTLRSDYASVVRNATLVLANTRYTLDRAQNALGPLPQASVCWLGTEADDPPALREPWPEEPVLLFLGRSDDLFAKGQDILIDIWPKVVSVVPKAKLLFVGGGPQLDKLRKLARVSPAATQIEVLGFLSEAEIEHVWRRASAFALLGNAEGFGLVCIEAMRHRLPIIASLDDASHEINQHGITGWNICRRDRDELIDRIALLLKDQDLARMYGQAAFARWKKHFCFSAFERSFKAVVSPWLRW
jgi:phosphatidyl-myo-inositol dimannoside synthase